MHNKSRFTWERATAPVVHRQVPVSQSPRSRGDDQLSAARKVLRRLWLTSYYTEQMGCTGATEPGRRPPRAAARDHKQRTIEEAEPVKPQRDTTVSSQISYKIRLG